MNDDLKLVKVVCIFLLIYTRRTFSFLLIDLGDKKNFFAKRRDVTPNNMCDLRCGYIEEDKRSLWFTVRVTRKVLCGDIHIAFIVGFTVDGPPHRTAPHRAM